MLSGFAFGGTSVAFHCALSLSIVHVQLPGVLGFI